MRTLGIHPSTVLGVLFLITLTGVSPTRAALPFPVMPNFVQSILFVDLNLDGQNEVVFATMGDVVNGFEVRAYTHQGVHLWTRPIPEYLISYLAAGSVDSDKYPEIVLGTQVRPILGSTCSLYVLDHNGGVQPGWPETRFCLRYSTPVLTDLDGTKPLEIVVHYAGGGAGTEQIEAWNGQGQLLWSIDGNGGYFERPVAANLDSSGLTEILIPLNIWTFPGGAVVVDGHLIAANADGTSHSFSVTVPDEIIHSPSIGDLDHDGDPEVVFLGSVDSAPQQGTLRVVDHQGTSLPGWPLSLSGPYGWDTHPVLGDLDDDGDLEIVLSNRIDRVYAWHHTGAPVAGFPLVDPMGNGVGFMQPLIGDADGDPGVEVVLFTDGCLIEAYDANTLPAPGYPLTTQSGSGTCWVNDALMGAVGTTEKLVYGLATAGPNVVKLRWNHNLFDGKRAHWPQQLRDMRRTSHHGFP